MTIQIPDHHPSTSSSYRTPLLLTPFPNNAIVAYGGDDGCLYLLSNPSEAIKRYDDCIRAVAVSPDGKRVAVGFDDGSTIIYCYDSYDNTKDDDDAALHPFLTPTQEESSSTQEDTDATPSSFAVRVQSSVRQLTFDPRGRYLSVVSEDGNAPLVVYDATDEASASTPYLGEESGEEHSGGGVRSVSYSDGGDVLSTLGMDGRFLAWKTPNALRDPSLEWEAMYKDVIAIMEAEAGEGMGSDAADRSSRLVWGSVGGRSIVLLPGKTDVQYRVLGEGDDHDLGKQKFVMEGGHKDVIVTMAWEPEGARFVTGGRDGKVFLWQMKSEGDVVVGSLVGEVTFAKSGEYLGIPPITSLIWMGNVIHVADASGAVYVVDAKGDFVGKSQATNQVANNVEESNDEVNELKTQTDDDLESENKESGLRRLGKKVAAKDDEDEDDSMFNEDVATAADQPANNESNKKKNDASRFIDDEADDDEDDATVDLPASNVETSAPSPEKDNTIYEDFTQPEPQDVLDANKDADEDMFQNHDDHFDPEPTGTFHPTTSSFPPLQPAFAPSSTPINETRRILCWNHVGVISSYPDTDSQYNVVDVAFHETAGLVGGRRPINFTDNLGFIVGSMGEEGALFASDLMEEEDDDGFDDGEFDNLGVMSEAARNAAKASRRKKKEDSGKGSQVYFNRFETFGRNTDKDWVVAMPDGERAVGCATGKGWSAVITSRRFLRLFTNAGVQGPMIWLSGEPVTIVGRGRFVGVFYHRSATPLQDGTQLLGYTIFDGMKGISVASGEVAAMSPGASLTWAGFTEVCALSVMDSEGMLSMLVRQSSADGGNGSGNWVPILDTVGHKKSSHDTYWPVEVHGGKLVCVLLRGGKEHPDATRRPVTTTLSLRMPLTLGVTKCGQVEELSVRGKIAVEQKKLLDDYNVAQGEGNINDAEDEYLKMSAQIDKVTLKLFNETIKSSKVERALSIVHRLHLEKSFDIAIQASDRMGHRKLSDLVEDIKLQRFPSVDEEDLFDDNNSYGSRDRSDSYDEASVTSNVEDQREVRGISPETQTPRSGRTSRDDMSESTQEESPPKASLKRKFDNDVDVSTKRRNPFAKKTMASPAKGIMKTPPSPAKLTLSRQSTFSAKSRMKHRSGKQIM